MPELLRQHQEGQKTYELKAERNRMKDELKKKREEIANDKSFAGEVAKTWSALTGTSQTRREEDRIADLSDKIYQQDSNVPEGPAPVPSLEDRLASNPTSATRSMAAISAGAVIGFGIGHSIQGIYGKQGWKWTLIDIGNIAGLSAASQNCTIEDPVTGRRETKDTGLCTSSTVALAAGLFVSRIWQGFEIAGDSSKAFSPYQVGVVPQADGGTLQAAWSW